jgi:hypothetical protein
MVGITVIKYWHDSSWPEPHPPPMTWSLPSIHSLFRFRCDGLRGGPDRCRGHAHVLNVRGHTPKQRLSPYLGNLLHHCNRRRCATSTLEMSFCFFLYKNLRGTVRPVRG